MARGLQDSDADDVAQDVLVRLFAALRKFRYDPEKSFRAWLETVVQHAWSDFLASRRKVPGHPTGPISQVADSAEAQSDLEEAFDRELLDLAMHRMQARVKPATWDAFQLNSIDGLSGAGAAQTLGMPVAHVVVAGNRVQKMLQEEVRLLEDRAGGTGGPITTDLRLGGGPRRDSR